MNAVQAAAHSPEPRGADRQHLSLVECGDLCDPARLEALAQAGLSAAPDPEMDLVAERVRRWLRVPVALVSLVQSDRQVFPGMTGLSGSWAAARETPLSHSFCQHVVITGAPLVITDARQDPRVAANLAIPDLGVVAYAGMPLTDATGNVLGSVCAIDHEPHAWTEDELAALADLTAGAAAELRLRLARHDADAERARRDGLEDDLRRRWEAEQTVQRRLGAVTDVALALARAQTVADLTAIVIEQGLAALGSDGCAVAVRDGDHLDLSITSSLGEHARTVYGRLRLDAVLPACVAVSTGAVVVLPDAPASRAFSPEMDQVVTDTGCQAWVALPMFGEQGVLGALVIGWAGPHRFTPAELDVLTTLTAQCSYGLERIRARQAERAAATQVARMAETLQRSMLTDPIQPDHLQLAVRYAAAANEVQVGGDWYDAFLDRDGNLCVVIGDVAGHDRNAAAVMGQLRNLLRGISYTAGQPPAAVLTHLDGALRHLGVATFTTAVVATIEQAPTSDPAGLHRLRWSNAGHPPPLMIGPDGSTRFLDATPEIVLGATTAATTGYTRSDHEHLVAPGSTLLLYTDGLIERRRADPDLGLAWLATTATALAGHTLDQLCDALLAAVEGHTDDDVALLAVRLHPENRPRPPEAGPNVEPTDIQNPAGRNPGVQNPAGRDVAAGEQRHL